MGRWKRHIYQGTADTIERKRDLKAGTMLDTPWAELAPELQKLWLYGTGDEHITYTWRGGERPMMYGGNLSYPLTGARALLRDVADISATAPDDLYIDVAMGTGAAGAGMKRPAENRIPGHGESTGHPRCATMPRSRGGRSRFSSPR